MLQTLQKASEVLELFDRSHTEWGVREVADRLGMAKSSAHDLLLSRSFHDQRVCSRSGPGRQVFDGPFDHAASRAELDLDLGGSRRTNQQAL